MPSDTVDEEVLTRTSWADGRLAYTKVKKGKAYGNLCALYIRWKLQRQLYNLGCFVQRHAGKVLFLGLLLLSLCCIGLKTATLETAIEKLWVEEGGRLQKELAYTRRALGEGHGSTNELIIQTPKNGGDVLNVESMLLHYKALRAATEVVVNVHNIDWSFKDICLTANFPRYEGVVEEILEKLMPCVIVTPLDCFWEGSKLLGPERPVHTGRSRYDWTNLNPQKMLAEMYGHFHDNADTLEDTMKRAGVTTAYQEKPCLDPSDYKCPITAPNKLNQQRPDVGAYLTGGCHGFATKFMHWEEDMIVGGVQKNKTGHITRAEALQSMVQLMGERQLYEHYTGVTKVHRISWTQEKAKEVVEEWQRQFTKTVKQVINGSAPDSIRPFSAASLQDLLDEFSQVSTIRLVFGYILMLIYACLALLKWTDAVQSQSGIGIAGVLLVALSVAAGLGVCSVLGIRFNASTTQIIPFLALGLGVDDMFLIAHTFAENADSPNIKHMEQTGVCLKRTGVSILLTSLSLICAFFIASIIPIPALRSFCLQVAILKLFNLFTILLIFPALVSLDLVRREEHRVDILCCFTGSSADQVIELTPRYGTPPPAYREPSPPRPYTNNYVGTRPGVPVVPVHQSVTQISPEGRVAETVLVSQHPETIIGHDPSSGCPSTTSSQQCLTSEDGTICSRQCVCSKASCCMFSLTCCAAHHYAPKLEKTPVKVLVITCFLLLLAIGIFGCTRVRDGLEMTDIVPRSTNEYMFHKDRAKYFGFYNFYAVTQGDFDYARGQKLLYEYHEAFQKVHKIIRRDDGSLPNFWLLLFRGWLKDLQEAFDRDVKHGFITESECKDSASDEGAFAYKLLLQTGDIDEPTNKDQVMTNRLVDDEGIINQKAFYNYLLAWVSNDALAYSTSGANFRPEPKQWIHDRKVTHDTGVVPKAQPLTYAQLPFFLHDMSDTEEVTETVKKIRSICDEFNKRGLPNYPSGVPFTYWEQYLHLRYYLALALFCVLATVFLILSLVLLNPWLAGIVVVVLTVIVIELFGFMGLIGLKLSAVPAVILIVSVGIGVEYTVHISVGFITCIGSRNRRMGISLQHFFAPVVHCAISTLLGLIMLAGSEFDFIVKYFFSVLSMLIILGLANGLVLLPVLLSLLGPKAEVIPADGSDRLQPPTPEPSPPRPRRARVHQRGHSRRVHPGVPLDRSLSTISEEATQYSSHEIVVQPEVVVETTLPGATTIVHSENPSDKNRNPSPTPTHESGTPTPGSHFTTRVTATAKVKVEVHTPLPGAVSEEHRYKSKRRKMEELEETGDSDCSSSSS